MDILDVTPFPEQIRLENTNACNAHCVMCPRESQTRKRGFIDPRLVEKILAEAEGKKITKFTVQGFGEPLLDKRFCTYVRLIKERLSCPTFTVSNGTLITPELAEELVSCGLDKIKISFYGTGKEEYERIHAPLKYDKARGGIMNLVRARRAARSKITIRVQYIGKLWKYIPFFFQWVGKTSVGYNTLHNYGNGRAYRSTNGKAGRCPILSQPILQVLWTGEVVPCCYDFNGTMVLGDVRRQSIEEIWHGERYQAIRRAHAEGRFSEWPLCIKCDKRF